VVQVVDFGIRFVMDSEDSFWNIMRKSYPSIRMSWIPFFGITFFRQSMLTLPLAMSLLICRIALLTLCM